MAFVASSSLLYFCRSVMYNKLQHSNPNNIIPREDSPHGSQSIHVVIEVLVLGDFEDVCIDELLRTLDRVDGFLE